MKVLWSLGGRFSAVPAYLRVCRSRRSFPRGVVRLRFRTDCTLARASFSRRPAVLHIPVAVSAYSLFSLNLYAERLLESNRCSVSPTVDRLDK